LSPLASQWNIHVGEPGRQLEFVGGLAAEADVTVGADGCQAAAGPMVHVHRLTSAPGRGLIAVRPDGHVGFRCQTADTNQLTAWLAHVNVPL
jgi:hypothetical protein